MNTQRLKLRPIELKFSREYFENVRRYPELFTYFDKKAHKNSKQTLEDFTKWVNRYYTDPYQWLIFTKDNTVIGKIDLHNYKVGWKTAEVGYELGPLWQGYGFMTEALNEVLKFVFTSTDIHVVSAVHHIDNIKSGAVLLRCGLEEEAILHERDCIDGIFYDQKLYYITRDMWERRQAEMPNK